MKNTRRRDILLISGSFLSIDIWDHWKEYFEFQGYNVIAPPWPNKSGSAVALREKHPDNNPKLALLTLAELVEYYAEIVEKMEQKPILIGHSMGGLITQILVNRELALAGVAIHSFPPQGLIPLELSFYRAGTKSLGVFTSVKKTYLMSFSDFQYAFVNEMSFDEQQEAYQKYAIPESKTVCRGAMTMVATVNFAKKLAPLLLTSGNIDNIIPSSLNKRNFLRYKDKGSVVEYKEFCNHNHFILGQAEWKEEAEFIAKWLSNNINL